MTARRLPPEDPVGAFRDAHARADAVALPTSGTSGTPRHVIRSTASWVDSFPTVRALCGLDPTSRVWVPGPLTATMNLFAVVLADHTGAARVGSPAEATHAFLTPHALGRLPDGELPAGAVCVVAGDRLSPSARAAATRAGLVVHHYYGAAELSFVAWGTDSEDLRPFPGVEVELRSGEVWVRSPYVCTGYDGPPGPLRRDADGWATVGDRGRWCDGRLVVDGRPDALTTGGATVLVADVEAVLRPAATGEVAVVGLPHDGLGAVLAVVLTRAEDHPGLRALARDRLTGGLRPRRWFVVEELPRSGAGKVDRGALVARLSSDGAAACGLL